MSADLPIKSILVLAWDDSCFVMNSLMVAHCQGRVGERERRRRMDGRRGVGGGNFGKVGEGGMGVLTL